MKQFDLGVVMYRAIVHKAAQNVTDYDTKNLTQILCWRWIKIALYVCTRLSKQLRIYVNAI